jgi:hypothetical protein
VSTLAELAADDSVIFFLVAVYWLWLAHFASDSRDDDDDDVWPPPGVSA